MRSYYRADEPGAVITIMQNNQIIFSKGYGISDLSTRKALTADDNFNIGSLTKQFTAFAVLKLFYEGRFSMTDSIGRFFSLPKNLSGIKIGFLLSHSSGIPDHYTFTDTQKVSHASDKDVLDALQKSDTLYFVPGTHYRYSNTAFCLLGLLIEKLSGLSYSGYLSKYIFEPLDIHDASVFRPGLPIARRVIGYNLSTDGKFHEDDAAESVFYSTEADGGIYISMNNYIKWCTAIETGKLSATQMIRYAWQPHTIVDLLHQLFYGCGWFIQRNPDSLKTTVVYHTGFNGGFRSAVLMIPAKKYCISIFSNRGDRDLEELIVRLDKLAGITDNSFIKSGPLESFNNSWPKFAPCKEISSFSTSFTKN